MIGVVVGSVFGWWLPHRSGLRERSARIEQEISSAASVCLGRLIKMQMASVYGNTKIYEGEKHHLGGDTDRYLKAISMRSPVRPSDLGTFEEMSKLLIGAVPESNVQAFVESLANHLRTQVASTRRGAEPGAR